MQRCYGRPWCGVFASSTPFDMLSELHVVQNQPWKLYLSQLVVTGGGAGHPRRRRARQPAVGIVMFTQELCGSNTVRCWWTAESRFFRNRAGERGSAN